MYEDMIIAADLALMSVDHEIKFKTIWEEDLRRIRVCSDLMRDAVRAYNRDFPTESDIDDDDDIVYKKVNVADYLPKHLRKPDENSEG